MFMPMAILAVLSLIVGGFYGTPCNDRIGEFLSPTVHSVPGLPTSDPRFWIADAVGLGVALIGIGVAWLRYGARQASRLRAAIALPSRSQKRLVHRRALRARNRASSCWRLDAPAHGLEDGALDGGTRGVGWLFAAGGRGLRALQTGYARNYALAIFFGAALILLYFMIFPQLRERGERIERR